jgi:hypothetical protein
MTAAAGRPKGAPARAARHARRLIVTAMAAGALLFLAKAAVLALHDASSLPLSDLALLLPALGLMTASAGLYGLTWGRIVARLAGRRSLPAFDVLRAFAYTWPARYIPGTVPYHASRLLLAERLGASRQAVAAAIGYEAVLSLGAAALLGLAALAAALGPELGGGPAYVFLVLPLLFIVPLLHPRFLTPIANRALAVAGRAPLTRDALLGAREAIAAFATYASVHALVGCAFYLLLRALIAGHPVGFGLAVGTYTLAGAAGVMALFMPSGLGVREAVVVSFLSAAIPAEQALVVAASARALSVASDVAFVAAIGACDIGRRALAPAVRRLATAPAERAGGI